MLLIVHKARMKMFGKMKEYKANKNQKQGFFITSSDELIQNDEENNKLSSSVPGPLDKLDEKAIKFLEQQNQTNNAQLKFFLKAHERQDINLKKKMEFALNCLQKREKLDKQLVFFPFIK